MQDNDNAVPADEAIAPILFSASREIVPLAPPQILRDLALRLTFLPAVESEEPPALHLEVKQGALMQLALKMRKGRVRVQFAGNLGPSREIDVSPAELVMLYNSIERFVQELPR